MTYSQFLLEQTRDREITRPPIARPLRPNSSVHVGYSCLNFMGFFMRRRQITTFMSSCNVSGSKNATIL